MTLAQHLPILPVAIPALAAPLILLVIRRYRVLGLALGFGSCAAMLAAALALMGAGSSGAIAVYALGGWAAPFGIVLVADRLAAIMLVLTACLALVALLHAVLTGSDRKGAHFHALFQFQLMGLNGAFLTGDLFNLFVFFEVLLIASYGLMLHGQGPARLKAGVQYVVVNLVGSALFLIALGLLYALTGTLNMADMGLRVAAIAPADQGLLRIAALLLASVFLLKAAVVPLHLWLVRTYETATPAVAGLFAILTKVGVYSLIRVVPQVFGEGAGAAAWVPSPYLWPAALVTAGIGFAGVFTARNLSQQAAYAIIGSTGTLLIAVAGWQAEMLGAALYYLVHSTIAGAALFLVADVVARARGAAGNATAPGPDFAGRQTIGLLFMATAIAVCGLPPLSGFIGKLLILGSVTALPEWGWAWGVILGTTLIGVIGFARAGSAIFWKAGAPAASLTRPMARADCAAPVIALLLLAALTIWAGPASAYAEAAAAQVLDPAASARAVLGEAGS
ncbi:MAG: monovalent cation/H+ antiporter subunit D [Erythrobacter sp.]|jgi:multicomponent K+:H+ antiporter subunit D|uniref:monovalent cation/H+ antiporter subunit D n=1 Tax=Erythrobacter sp. TaxID=1042 RepID=UPI002B4A0257|nr:monovalent cation/H+ antiporter subunit D [Erythrobacter sp.]WRH69438.1 MAG: monovalent cation/H+ antiporter subunit D [Erythrobacter sp.]